MQDSQLKQFVGGFTLTGMEQPDGSIKPYLGEDSISCWPQEITILGTTYSLESTSKTDKHMEAEYA